MQFASLAGRPKIHAFPGTTEGGPGTLENCQLAPVTGEDDLRDMALEVERIFVDLAPADGGDADRAGDPPDAEPLWLGVVKRPVDVAADNDGDGSRGGWTNLDGSPARVCDADWLDVGGEGEQPDGSEDGAALDTRLVLRGGYLMDYPKYGDGVSYAVYKCCVEAAAFSSCGAAA